MRKKLATILTCAALSVSLAACGQQQAASSESNDQAAETQQTVESEDATESEEQLDATDNATTAATAPMGTVANTIADDEDALVATYADKFTQETYTDADTGLSVTYNLFLPEGYDESASYPMVVFIADSSCAGAEATRSLTQGLGALVWATDEWQAAHPTIVCVPTYPETILDDHGSYTTTEYVELTRRLIDSVSSTYAVDASRIYGTGQSMGCMTTLILASEYPDLYAGCMLVDGQWDVSVLGGLEGQRFVYFAAEDDQSAFSGMSEVKEMFDNDAAPYATAQWDGNWSNDELSAAANELFSQGQDANFISWASGTIDASSGGMMGGGMNGGPNGGMGGDKYEPKEFNMTELPVIKPGMPVPDYDIIITRLFHFVKRFLKKISFFGKKVLTNAKSYVIITAQEFHFWI
jgi:poly(3-hydroxybutyrate) depolymerase